MHCRDRLPQYRRKITSSWLGEHRLWAIVGSDGRGWPHQRYRMFTTTVADAGLGAASACLDGSL